MGVSCLPSLFNAPSSGVELISATSSTDPGATERMEQLLALSTWLRTSQVSSYSHMRMRACHIEYQSLFRELCLSQAYNAYMCDSATHYIKV